MWCVIRRFDLRASHIRCHDLQLIVWTNSKGKTLGKSHEEGAETVAEFQIAESDELDISLRYEVIARLLFIHSLR